MALAVGRGLLTLPCSSLAFLGKDIGKPSVTYLPARKGHGRHFSRTVVQAQERPYGFQDTTLPPTWMEAGDFGFDPLGLSEDPEDLKWYVQAELVHACFAMAGVAGILFTDLIRITGIKNLPVWYEAGATKFQFASTRTLFFIQLVLMGYSTFFGITHYNGFAAFVAFEHKRYPGGPLLNPLGIAKDIKSAGEWKLKEITNGRLAMVVMLGFFLQANLTHVGPIDNLVDHLSDPWHRTIIQTLAGSGS